MGLTEMRISGSGESELNIHEQQNHKYTVVIFIHEQTNITQYLRKIKHYGKIPAESLTLK
jgi:hypothetical protein